jgi:hypothetical protein
MVGILSWCVPLAARSRKGYDIYASRCSAIDDEGAIHEYGNEYTNVRGHSTHTPPETAIIRVFVRPQGTRHSWMALSLIREWLASTA